jgi:tetratricopeptide (TPR) repeat protein
LINRAARWARPAPPLAPGTAGRRRRPAQLRYSKLAGVDAKGADFSLSDLSRTDLSNAHLEGATFTGAELRGAKMSGVAIDADTDFRKTAWWLAEGWPPGARPALLAQSSPEMFTSTHPYRDGLEPLNNAVRRSNNAQEHSVALNSRGWYKAIRGDDLEGALRDAQEALVLAPLEPHILDTRGYIYLRQGRKHEALTDCQESVDLLRGLGVGESVYHLGLAWESVGDEQSAAKAFDDARRQGYRPTYELLLTPRINPQLSAGGAVPGS